MKFAIEKSIILEALNNVTKALSQRTTIPILNGIVFDVDKKGIELLASDSELTIKVKIDEKNIKSIEGKGKIIIQSPGFLEIIKKMPADIINFEVKDQFIISISTPFNEYNLNCFNPLDYPNINLETTSEAITIKSSILKSMINQTSYALSTQEIRPILTGLNLNLNGDILECIATDSYRLAKKTIKLPNPINKLINIVLPGRSIIELEKILAEEDDVEIHLYTNKILFVYKNILIQSNLLNGTYPETQHFIPQQFEYIINLKLQQLYDAVDRASLLAQNKGRNLIKMHLDGKKLIISSIANELGNAEEQITVDSNNKEVLDISCSSKYILEALKVINEESILLLFNAEDKPFLIKSVTDESLIELIEPEITY